MATSGTITSGGTAQEWAAANTYRKGWFIQNNSSGDLWVREDGTDAAASQPAIKIAAGAVLTGSLVNGDYVPRGAVSIIGATTGQAYSGREW